MEKKVETAIMGYIGTTIKDSFLHPRLAKGIFCVMASLATRTESPASG